MGEGCFLNYELTYGWGDRGENNFFGLYGTLLHDTIEDLHNGKISKLEVPVKLKREMARFKYKVPFRTMEKNYVDGINNFFKDFDKIFENYNILEAEEKQLFSIDDIQLIGFPDLVAEHKEYGFIIGDYKTAKPYVGDKLTHNIQQLYLYSIPIYLKYGKYPDHLVYIYSREKEFEDREVAIPFNMEDLERTKQFVRDTVYKIENHKGKWHPRCRDVDGEKDWFANFLCNHRESCKEKNHFKKKRKSFGDR